MAYDEQLANQIRESLSDREDVTEKEMFSGICFMVDQDKKDKQFADEVDVTPAVLSQYINNHRKPKDEFVIRLGLHSNGMIPAISWFKVIQKDKEHEIMTSQELR